MRGRSKLRDCHPGKGCLSCPYPDCLCGQKTKHTQEEREMRAGTRKDTEGKGDALWTYKNFGRPVGRSRRS